MKKVITIAALAASSILLTACGVGKDNAIPPAALVNFTPSMNVQSVWSHQTGNGDGGYYLRLVPAADSNMVFTASHNGSISALDAKTGKIIWSVRTRFPFSSGLAAGDGKVYVGTSSAQVVAFDEQTGKMVWNQPVSNEVLAPVQYANGHVFIHTISGSLIALSSQDGQKAWRYDHSMPSLVLHAAGQPQLAGNKLVVGFSNGMLGVFNQATGQGYWEQHIAYPTGDNPVSQMVDITVNPVVINGIVYAASYQGNVAAYNLDNGSQIWQHPISSYAGIAATTQQIFVSDADSNVLAFDADSGAVDWKQNQLLGRQITGPVIYNNSVVVADRLGYIHFISLTDGHFLARVKMGNGALAQPMVYQGMLYVYTANGTLLACRAVS